MHAPGFAVRGGIRTPDCIPGRAVLYLPQASQETCGQAQQPLVSSEAASAPLPAAATLRRFGLS